MGRRIVGTLAVAALFATSPIGSVAVAESLGQNQIQTAVAAAAPDPAKIPHYFGPWPNWALSPLVKNNATVTITGDGTGAAATATLDPVTGAIVSIDVTARGSGYSTAPDVTITGGTSTATATASIQTTGGVTHYDVTNGGHGYTGFSVSLTGGGGSGATMTADGGVDSVRITNGGRGYTMPTVEFALPDDPNGKVAKGHVPNMTLDGRDGLDANGTVTEVVVDEPGSGYYSPPDIAIHNGTVMDPVNFPANGGPATATTLLTLTGITAVNAGSGYTSAPTVSVSDTVDNGGTGATATAFTDAGFVNGITVNTPGAGFLTGGIKKFQDELPVPCDPAHGGCPTQSGAKFIPVGVPENKAYSGIASDEYVIGLVQYKTKFSSDLPPTMVRGYVQIETPANVSVSQHVPLTNTLMNGTQAPVIDAAGNQVYGVTAPQWLGPFIGSTKDRPTRIVFHNYLPKGSDGNLFLPVDSTMMGSGMGPMAMTKPVNDGTVFDGVRNPECTDSKDMCFKDNRATLHLHGGITPWISDGTPHQWITPAGESTQWPQGVSVQNVPDMNVCGAKDDGCQTFYYTNQQSARLMFYHDHAWGITRLNVYAGEAAGYSITDDTEKALVNSGTIPGPADTLPLVVQDRTFVPGNDQLYDAKDANGATTSYGQDPTWDAARWGGEGSFWYHHVYMPAQNPGDPSGFSAYGRWMYGAWFYPPNKDLPNGPIDNPYYDPACKLDIPSTWTYQVDPFCEPKQIPGTPNISAGMEQFNDTPIVNGIAYPKVTLQPKTYRLRFLNAANDRFFNFQWYVADPSQGQRQDRGGVEAGRAGRRADRPECVTDPGAQCEHGRPGLDPDRFGGRLVAGPRGHRRSTGDDLDHRPDAVQRRQRGQAQPAGRPGRTSRRHRRLLQVRRQDAHLVQRRTGGFPGAGVDVRLLHRWAGPGAERFAGYPSGLWTEHPHGHAGDHPGRVPRSGVQPHQAADRVQAQRQRHRRLRVGPAPDHRRAGGIQPDLRVVVRGGR